MLRPISDPHHDMLFDRLAAVTAVALFLTGEQTNLISARPEPSLARLLSSPPSTMGPARPPLAPLLAVVDSLGPRFPSGCDCALNPFLGTV